MKLRAQGERQEQLSGSVPPEPVPPPEPEPVPPPVPPPELGTPFVPSTRCDAVEHPIPDRSTRRGGRETEGAALLRGRIM